MTETTPQPDLDRLDVVQRWFQAVITHPGGVDEGIESNGAQQLVRLQRHELESVVRRSKNLSAHERLSIYANAYYARLLECLGEDFPVLKRTLGDELFNEFAFGYLQAFPSQSYTLNRLSDHFAEYLQASRPDLGDDAAAPAADWPDFLIDLVRLERTIAEVFDGPGVEKMEPISADALRAIPTDAWPSVRLQTAVCLKLLHFRYPVNSYYTTARATADQEPLPVPEPAGQWVAINRLDYVVRRHELSRPQYALLESLVEGQTVGQAIAQAADSTPDTDDQLAAALQGWFRTWCADRFFQAVDIP